MFKNKILVVIVCTVLVSPSVALAYDPMDYQKTLMQYNQIKAQHRQWEIENQQSRQMLELMQQQQKDTQPVAPPKTNNQICGDTYLNSTWYGKYSNESGALECDCKSGFTWNNEKTSCVIIHTPKTTTSIQPLATPEVVKDTLPPTKKVGWLRQFLNWFK